MRKKENKGISIFCRMTKSLHHEILKNGRGDGVPVKFTWRNNYEIRKAKKRERPDGFIPAEYTIKSPLLSMHGDKIETGIFFAKTRRWKRGKVIGIVTNGISEINGKNCPKVGDYVTINKKGNTPKKHGRIIAKNDGMADIIV